MWADWHVPGAAHAPVAATFAGPAAGDLAG